MKITSASYRRRAGTIVPKPENLKMKEANHATITDTPLWHKIWQHNCCNPTRVKQNLLKKPRKVLGADEEAQSHLHQHPLNWASLVKNYPGIIARHVARAMRRVKELLLQSRLDNE